MQRQSSQFRLLRSSLIQQSICSSFSLPFYYNRNRNHNHNYKQNIIQTEYLDCLQDYTNSFTCNNNLAQRMQDNQSKTKNESRVIKEETIHEAKWLGLKYTTYSIGQRIVPNYQTVYRTTTKKSGRDIDGVEVIPIIKYADKSKCSEVVFIANFRPPTNGFVLEFPSGLLQSDNYEQNAKRQVLEQTGYNISKFITLPTPKMFCDPWKSNQSGLFYIGIVDGDDPQHKKHQQLESEENIIVHKLPLNDKLIENVTKLVEANKYLIEGKVWSVCIGLAMKEMMKGVGVEI